MRTYGKYAKLSSTVIFGGVGIHPQIAQFKRGVDILVATPGRLLDHMGQRTVNLSHVEILVLDEADRMLDMGFIRDIKRILALLPKRRQNLLFSATFSDEIKALADGLLNAPAMIEVARRNSTVEIITQKVHPVDRDRKRELLSHLIKTQNWHQVLVFTRTKHGANKLAEQLNDDGITALAIHGNKSQSARTRALAEFKDGDLQVLVATDIAARGIDIDQLPHVVNYDLPNVPEDYVHRIGRTGRAGATGEADFAGLRRRARVPARHRAADQARDPVRRRTGLHARSQCASAADPAASATRGGGGTRATAVADKAVAAARRRPKVAAERKHGTRRPDDAEVARPHRASTTASKPAGAKPAGRRQAGSRPVASRRREDGGRGSLDLEVREQHRRQVALAERRNDHDDQLAGVFRPLRHFERRPHRRPRRDAHQQSLLRRHAARDRQRVVVLHADRPRRRSSY